MYAGGKRETCCERERENVNEREREDSEEVRGNGDTVQTATALYRNDKIK